MPGPSFRLPASSANCPSRNGARTCSSSSWLVAHRGLLDILPRLRLQPRTRIGLDSGRPESLRQDTPESLNALRRDSEVESSSERLHLSPLGCDEDFPRGRPDLAPAAPRGQGLGRASFSPSDGSSPRVHPSPRREATGVKPECLGGGSGRRTVPRPAGPVGRSVGCARSSREAKGANGRGGKLGFCSLISPVLWQTLCTVADRVRTWHLS